jgi:predicted DNA-binding ribbon-helix-helix protein
VLGWNQLFNTKTFSVVNIEFSSALISNADTGSATRSIQPGVQLDCRGFSCPMSHAVIEYHMAHLRGQVVKSSVSKRSIVIAGHKTSVSIEDAFWNGLKEIAAERDMTLGALVAAIDGNRQNANLSSAIRLFVLGVYRDQRR